MKKEECEFKRLRPRIRFVPGQGIEEVIRFVQRINSIFKGRKIVRRKNILQCRKCGRYSVECPYCHQSSVMAVLPKVVKCPHCGKFYQAKLFEL